MCAILAIYYLGLPLPGSGKKDVYNYKANARPPRLAGLPNVGTCNCRYAGI